MTLTSGLLVVTTALCFNQIVRVTIVGNQVNQNRISKVS